LFFYLVVHFLFITLDYNILLTIQYILSLYAFQLYKNTYQKLFCFKEILAIANAFKLFCISPNAIQKVIHLVNEITTPVIKAFY